MNIRKSLLVLAIISAIFLSLTAVSAGWFDFLGNGGETQEENIFDQFDYACAEINVSDEDNSVYVIDLVEPEYTQHVQNDLGTRDMSDEGLGEVRIVTGYSTNTNSSCTLGIKTSVDLSNVTFTRLELNHNSSLGTQLEKELTGNLTDILAKSLKNESNMTVSGFSISFTPHENYDRNTDESYSRGAQLNPNDIAIKDGKMTFAGQINDTSNAYDLTKIEDSTATIHLSIGELKNPIYISINIPITNG